MALDSSASVSALDVYVDMQYAKREEPKRKDCINTKCGSCDKCNYINEPWKHCQNPTNTFLSMRYSERDNFKIRLKEVDVEHWEHVIKEEERIKCARARFEAVNDEKKNELLRALKSAREEWREEVVENKESYKVTEVGGAMTMSEREFQKRQDRDWEEKRRHDLELKEKNKAEPRLLTSGQKTRYFALLGRVPDWPEIEQPSPSKEKFDPNDIDDFKAGVMYFKRDKESTGWIGTDLDHGKCRGNFPNQKIKVHDLLANTPDNPLSKTEASGEPEFLRYFHLSSNHMRWVEVRLLDYCFGLKSLT
jgi:hypothetical protein